MINLIKSDLYRLFRSKTYKNCALGAFGVVIFVLGISIFTDVELWIMAFTGNDGIRRGFMIGLEQVSNFKQLIINALGSGAGIYIISIALTSSVIISKTRSGIMKNTVSYGYERWRIYLSQAISLMVGMSILITFTALFILIITTFVFKGLSINYEDILLLIKSLVLYMVIVSATISIYMLLATIIPNSEVISVIAIVEMVGLAMVGPILSTKVNSFIPYSMIRILAQIPDSIDFTSYLINGLIIITISTLLGIAVFNKKEIK